VVPYQRQDRDTHTSPEFRNLSPHSTSPVHSKGTSLLVGQIDDMRKRFRKDPKDLEALVYLGNANFDIQRFDQARDLYLKALEVDPNNAHVRTDLASCFRNLGESDRAIRELMKVIEIEPSHATALYNLGVIFLNDKKDPTEAIRFWEAFAREYPQSAMSAGLNQKINQLKKESP
jgi:tetratricopeptide (TPR) repeat protein